MKKLRLSYSLIDTWLRGEPDRTVSMYFHLDNNPTPQMVAGKEFHEEMAEYIGKHKAFPDWFFKWDLKDPEPEKELVVSYNDMFDLKGIIDLLDKPYVFEFKTGTTDSSGWARTDQVPFYFLLCELAGIDVNTAYLIRHNQYLKTTDFSVIHNSKEIRDHAREVIDSYAPEIYEFFNKEGLL